MLLAAPSWAGSRVEDLNIALHEYVDKSPVFTTSARTRAQTYVRAVTPKADGMTPAEFLLTVLRIAALADNGHDTEHDKDDVWFPESRLPVRMIWFPNDWVIARTDSAHSDLLGGCVLTIEGRSADQLFRSLRKYWGGPDTSRRWNLEWLVENSGLLHAAGLARQADRLEITVRRIDGRQVTRTLFFEPKALLPEGQYAERVWSPEPWPGEAEKAWQAFTPRSTPLYLRDGARYFRVVHLPELEALFIQLRIHFDAPGETVAEFCKHVDEMVEHLHPHNLIVDERFDTGGNIDLTREWQRQLVARIPGRIYILIGRYTFSAGIVAAAAFKHDAADRARLIGEPVGDRLRWWSEGTDVCMPNSKYCIHQSTGLWDLVRGCSGDSACYGDKYDARVRDLEPDIAAPLTSQMWLAGQDPAMDAIQRDLSETRAAR